jgi:acyl carrier protein
MTTVQGGTAPLAELLREQPLIGDAEVLRDAGGITVLVVRRGYRPGPVVRDLVMGLAGEAGRGARVAIVSEIPRDGAGAVDEAAAWAAVRAASVLMRYEPPASEIERVLAGLVGELLPEVRVSMTDDLAVLGGDSLFAVELVALIAERLGVEVDAQELFAAESVREMAAVVGRAVGGGGP